MDLFKKRFLWIPPLGFAALFLLDKLFFLPAITNHTVHWQKIEPAFYQSRALLFEQLKEEYPERQAAGQKLGLILGTSRAGEFEESDIAKLIPGSYTYNFSAPFSSPVFFAYWLERIFAEDMRPEFVIFEIDPILMTDRAMEFTMQYSLDGGFVWDRTEFYRRLPSDPWQAEGLGFSYDEAESYAAAALFGLHRYPIKIDSIVANNKSLDSMGMMLPFSSPIEFRDHVKEIMLVANREKLGGIPNPMLAQKRPDEMRADAQEKTKIFLEGFQISPTQIIFIKNTLRDLARRKIPVVVYWPAATAEYHENVRAYQMIERVQQPLRKLLVEIEANHPGSFIKLYDPNPDPAFQCRAFYDSHHLSGGCFPELTRLLISRFPAKLFRPAGAARPREQP